MKMKVSFFVIGLSGACAGWSAANPAVHKAMPANASREGTILRDFMPYSKLSFCFSFFVVIKMTSREQAHIAVGSRRLNGRS
jgi:hypothetical protein